MVYALIPMLKYSWTAETYIGLYNKFIVNKEDGKDINTLHFREFRLGYLSISNIPTITMPDGCNDPALEFIEYLVSTKKVLSEGFKKLNDVFKKLENIDIKYTKLFEKLNEKCPAQNIYANRKNFLLSFHRYIDFVSGNILSNMPDAARGRLLAKEKMVKVKMYNHSDEFYAELLKNCITYLVCDRPDDKNGSINYINNENLIMERCAFRAKNNISYKECRPCKPDIMTVNPELGTNFIDVEIIDFGPVEIEEPDDTDTDININISSDNNDPIIPIPSSSLRVPVFSSSLMDNSISEIDPDSR